MEQVLGAYFEYALFILLFFFLNLQVLFNEVSDILVLMKKELDNNILVDNEQNLVHTKQCHFFNYLDACRLKGMACDRIGSRPRR